MVIRRSGAPNILSNPDTTNFATGGQCLALPAQVNVRCLSREEIHRFARRVASENGGDRFFRRSGLGGAGWNGGLSESGLHVFDREQQQDHEQEVHKRCLLRDRHGQIRALLIDLPAFARLRSDVPICAFLLLLGTTTIAPRPWPFPTAEGTTWRYVLTHEPEQEQTVLTRQIAGVPKSTKTEGPFRLEQKLDGSVKFAEWLTRQKEAVLATAERGEDGTSVVLNPPATILPGKMEPGASWNFRGQIAGADLTLVLKIISEEEIKVAAGKFRTWHIRGEQTGLVTTVAEQWFAPGVGWVKEVVTQRSPTGQLIDRRSVEMTALPSAQPSARTAPPDRPFEASISTSTVGAPMDVISANALQIIARWRVHREIGNAKVRVVWIAEDTAGLVPADYKIDEATAVATPPESVGTFTLSRPADGWAAGRYRVEFYVQDALVATARVIIAARASASNFSEEFLNPNTMPAASKELNIP